MRLIPLILYKSDIRTLQMRSNCTLVSNLNISNKLINHNMSFIYFLKSVGT